MISINTRGLDEVKATLEGLQGTRAVGIVTEAAANKIVDIMREQPSDTPYVYINRADAYGDVASDGAPAGYFSWKQFRFVMAAMRSGSIQIPYKRTGRVSGAWRVSGRLSKAKVVNDNDAAPYVFGDDTQSRHEDAVGWERVSVRLDNQSNRILDASYAALHKYIESRKKKK